MKLSRRQDDTSSPLSTGAIAGLVIGVAGLFLVAAGLFVVYTRRMLRYRIEEELGYHEGEYMSPYPPVTTMYITSPTYTLDHKYPSSGAPYAETQQSSWTTKASGSHGKSSDNMSAMPTHPAYIPRAMFRQTLSDRTTAIPLAGPLPAKFEDDMAVQSYPIILATPPEFPLSAGASSQHQQPQPIPPEQEQQQQYETPKLSRLEPIKRLQVFISQHARFKRADRSTSVPRAATADTSMRGRFVATKRPVSALHSVSAKTWSLRRKESRANSKARHWRHEAVDPWSGDDGLFE